MTVIATLLFYSAPIFLVRKEKKKLGLHLVLVTLHGRFTISIEQDK